MLHLLSNPGVFHQPEAYDGILSIIGFIGLAILVATIVVAVYLARKGSPSRKQNVYASLGCAISLGIFISLFVHEAIVREEAQTKYYSSVSNWLAADYGIKANPGDANQLIKGKTFATAYHSKTISISIIKNLNGDLAVVNQNSTVLIPGS